jgi:hypothetical protein
LKRLARERAATIAAGTIYTSDAAVRQPVFPAGFPSLSLLLIFSLTKYVFDLMVNRRSEK